MILKLLEALFRHKLLVLLPPILIPAIVAPVVIATAPTYYESAAGIWVDRPAYLDIKDPASQYTSPALAQSNALTELLHTRTFALDVASRTSLAPLVSARGGDARIQDLLDKGGVVVSSSGSHLVVLKTRASTAQLAGQLAQATIDAYQDHTSSNQLDQSGVAISFYQSQLQDAQEQQAKASQALQQYAAAMGYGSTDPTAGPAPDGSMSASSLDPKFAELQSTAKFSQQQVDQARAALQQAQYSSAAAVEGGQVGFQVIDPPQIPTAPTSNSKNIIVFIVAALVVGLGISGMLLVLLVAGDRSIRRDTDMTPSLRLLGVLPMLTVKRMPKLARQTATRRAMGFVAGTALPAPRGAGR